MALLVGAAVLLSACGGSGGSDGPPVVSANPGGGAALPEGEGVPSEASSSVASMLSWVKSLGTSETTQPYRLESFRPPLDDVTETSPG